MTATAIALGLRTRYPLQAARGLAFRRWMLAWGMELAGPRRPKRFVFWLCVCRLLDKEPINVC